MKEPGPVTISLYNTLGQRVRTVYRGTPAASEQEEFTVEADDLSGGLYFLRLKGEGVTATKKITVVQ
jgi:hypothetical protein